jgi:Tetratricopeptide repeat
LCTGLGDVQLRLGENDKAIQTYLRGVELIEPAVKANPANDLIKLTLSGACEKLGDAYRKLGLTD